MAALAAEVVEAARLRLQEGDVVVAHKVVSVAEGRVVPLAEVQPSEEAVRLAREVGKDPRLERLVLREPWEVVRVLQRHFGCAVGVVVADTWGRAHREGTVRVCIGLAGMEPLWTSGGCATCTATYLPVP